MLVAMVHGAREPALVQHRVQPADGPITSVTNLTSTPRLVHELSARMVQPLLEELRTRRSVASRAATQLSPPWPWTTRSGHRCSKAGSRWLTAMQGSRGRTVAARSKSGARRKRPSSSGGIGGCHRPASPPSLRRASPPSAACLASHLACRASSEETSTAPQASSLPSTRRVASLKEAAGLREASTLPAPFLPARATTRSPL
mmetsp:Transcript_3282/g.7830  ORF Transcript_3282/g.7830 Transcript_3282/m.7830 type:complete len:202 (-) Transcript_3282:256-861(-)